MSIINVLNPIHAWPSKASYELRLAKYAKRGFKVLIPGLDNSRIDYDCILPADIGSLKGLARLLKVSQEMESNTFCLVPKSIWGDPERVGCESSPEKIHLHRAFRIEMVKCRDGAESLTSGHGRYDELGFDVIVPSAMCRISPTGDMWYDWLCTFPYSDGEIRNEAWNEILDYENAPEALPRRLLDAWDTGKRSREYLNGEMDSFDLNSIYYSEAYRE